jgi:hypothetical protein
MIFLYAVSAIPKLLLWGQNPSKELKLRITRKKATWIEMEFHSAAYTWKTVFKYPLCLLRPLGAVLIISVILLNLYPPPLLYGSSCCIFYNLILGGAIYTWFVNYMSPKHSIPLFVTLFLVIILSSNNDNSPTAETKAKSWMSDTFIGTFIPLLMGFLCGPVFLKLGKIESNMTTKPWIKFFWR